MDTENLISDSETFLYYEDGLIDSPQIIEKLLDIKKSNNYSTNLTKPWPDGLIPEGVGEVKIWEVLDTSICSYFCYRIAEVFPKTRTNEYGFGFQVTEWQPGSFIPWHCDSPHLCALTCYLEDKTEYGGEFLCKPFEDQSLGMQLDCVPNRAVFLKGVKHCVTKIHKGTRTTLQVWGTKLNADI
jgi:hypothetical protein